MVNKINEIIESVNAGLDPAEVLAIVRTELENYYTKEEVDDLIASIDLSPYYTKTEVDAIISRVDGDVDALEGRMDTAEGDIDNLEQTKQDVMSAGEGIAIANDTVSINNGWEPFTVPSDGNIDVDNYDYLLMSSDDKAMLVHTKDDLVPLGGASLGGASRMVTLSGRQNIRRNAVYITGSSGPVSQISLYTLGGVLIDSTNIDTYFDTSTSNIVARVPLIAINGGNGPKAIIGPSDTSVVFTRTQVLNGSGGTLIRMVFVKHLLTNIYNFIKNGTTYNVTTVNYETQDKITPITSAYRRKR